MTSNRYLFFWLDWGCLAKSTVFSSGRLGDDPTLPGGLGQPNQPAPFSSHPAGPPWGCLRKPLSCSPASPPGRGAGYCEPLSKPAPQLRKENTLQYTNRRKKSFSTEDDFDFRIGPGGKQEGGGGIPQDREEFQECWKPRTSEISLDRGREYCGLPKEFLFKGSGLCSGIHY